MIIKNIKKGSFILFVIIILFFYNITALSTININPKSNKNFELLNFLSTNYDIIIPDNYSTIQEGINSANPGDTILIRSGIYKEYLVIKKPGITLQGEDRYKTILDGCKSHGEGIIIKAEDVTINNLTIQNYKNHEKEDIYAWNQSGIEIHSSNVTVNHNYFVDNGVGIELLLNAYNITISYNEMINDGILIGNYIGWKTFPKINPNDFLHNIFNNTINGKPLYYYKNENNFAVPKDAGQITMVNCSNFTIENIHMSNNDFSILLAFCSNSLIENITISNTNGEMLLFACENIKIQHNIITNTFKAICLEYNSNNNIIKHNDLSFNYMGISLFNNANNNTIYQNNVYDNYGSMASGIEIVSYHGGNQRNNNITENKIYNNPIGITFRQNTINNTIYHNNITKNKIGIYLEKSSDYNKIIKNILRKNIIQAIFNGCLTNTWDNNYWNRPRTLPKVIFGLKTFRNISIPWINIDKNPLQQII